MFCTNCGKQFPGDAKFCPECGAPVAGAQPQNPNQRTQSFAGEVRKCPNCGEVLDSFMVNCPSCGCEFRHVEVSSAVKELASKLAQIESMKIPSALLDHLGQTKPLEQNQASVMKRVIGWDFNEKKRREEERKAREEERRARQNEIRNRESKFEQQKIKQKADLICNFPVPNTREDILEFMLLASSNIDYRRIDDTLSKTWITKLDQVYQKAEISFKDHSDFERIREIYAETQKKIRRTKLIKKLFIGGIVALVLFLEGLSMNPGATICITIVALIVIAVVVINKLAKQNE